MLICFSILLVSLSNYCSPYQLKQLFHGLLFSISGKSHADYYRTHWCLALTKHCCTFKISEAKQRKASLEKAVEKAKVGRQDTVRICSHGKMQKFKIR